jgi:hypothetical protein
VLTKAVVANFVVLSAAAAVIPVTCLLKLAVPSKFIVNPSTLLGQILIGMFVVLHVNII